MNKIKNKVTFEMYKELKEYIIKYKESDYKDDNIMYEVTNKTYKLISKLSLNFLDDFPFLFNILYKTDKRVNYMGKACMSVSIEDYQIYLNINPVLLVKICKDDTEIYGVLLHEILHLLYKHLLRYNKEFEEGNGDIINLATDCQINQEIKLLSSKKNNLNNEVRLPLGGVTLNKIKNILGKNNIKKDESSRYYYNLLKVQKESVGKEKFNDIFEDFKNDLINELVIEDELNVVSVANSKVNDNVDILNQEGMEKSNNKDKMYLITANKLLEKIIKDSYEKLSDKQRGILSRNILKEIEKAYKKPSLDWKKELNIGISNLPSFSIKDKKRLNRRNPYRIDLSGRKRIKTKEIIIFMDVSGSMSNKDISYVMAEIFNILNKVSLKSCIKLIQIDSEIKSVDIIKSIRDLDILKRKGSGGTTFQVAYDYLKENKYTNKNSYAVYFTDGYGERTIEDYGYKMNWVVTVDGINRISAFPNLKVPCLYDDIKLNRRLKRNVR